jgi:uncharacterized membrane protein YbhN (UPF0104 family)
MIRRWVFWFLVVAFLWLLVANRTELRDVAVTLASGRWAWIALAAALQAAYYLVYAELYRGSFEVVGVPGRFGDALVPLLGSLFVNVAIPSGGAAGAALFVDAAARRGHSRTRAAAGYLLAMVVDLASLALVVLGAMVYLVRAHRLSVAEVVGAALLALLTAGLAALLLIGLWRPGWLHATLGAFEGTVARIARLVRRPSPLGAGWAARAAGELIAVSTSLGRSRGGLGRLLLVALGMHALDCASLGALFPAFGQPVVPGVIVAGYALGILAWILSPVMQGIGVVEGVLALVFSSLGVPAGPATVIAVAFRGLTFWLPMAVGFVLIRAVRQAPAGSGNA